MAHIVSRISVIVCTLAILVTAVPCAVGGPTPVSRPVAQPRRVSQQVKRLDKADLTFNSFTTRSGGVEVDAQGGDLLVRKTVQPDGSSVLDLQSPHEKLLVGFDQHAITVTRNRKTATLNLATATEEDFDRVHQMLADSHAVRLLRAAAANLEDSEDDSAESASLLMADAVVGMLTGDGAAPRRVARHLARHLRSRTRAASMQVDCYSVWEQRVYLAYTDLEACEGTFSPWNPTRYLCAARFLIQAESYWFSFISCSGFSQF